MSRCLGVTGTGSRCSAKPRAGSEYCGRHAAQEKAERKILTPQEFKGEFGTAELARTKLWLSTGNYALNWAISGRFLKGWPFGRVAEIFGDPSTGKSYLLLNAFANVMQMGGYALFDDVEGGYFPEWGSGKLGIDNKKLGYSQSQTIADHYALVKRFIDLQSRLKEPLPAVIALDSASLLTTEHELEKAFETRDMTRASEFRTLLRTLGNPLQKLPTLYLATNHVIANIGDMFHPRTTPTGGGFKFQASVRLDLQQPTRIKDPNTKEPLGVLVNAYVEKSRVGVPWRRVKFAIPFFQRISPTSGLIPILLQLGILVPDSSGKTASCILIEGAQCPLKGDNFLAQDTIAAEYIRKYPQLLELADSHVAQMESEYSFVSAVMENGDPAVAEVVTSG